MAQTRSTAAPAGAEAPALLTLQVPADAVVYLGNRRMMTQGTSRTYQIPVNVANASFSYKVRVELERNGQKLVAASTQTVSSGGNIQLLVNEPTDASAPLAVVAAK